MKIEKNKIVFAGVIGTLLLFLGSYGYWMLTDDPEPENPSTQPEIPYWEDPESEYSTKLEAIDALKEERETTAPSVYPEHMMDEKGYFNPDYMEYEKQRLIDSIQGQRPYAPTYQFDFEKEVDSTKTKLISNEPTPIDPKTALSTQKLGLEHQLFFAANPKSIKKDTSQSIPVEVDGKQVLRKNSRIRLRLREETTFKDHLFPKHTVLFGTVRFRPNRVLLQITQMGSLRIAWQAHDLQDGMLGLYLENSLREEATREVAEDVIQDINIAGLPQVRGLKNVFQRRQRNLKVTVLDGHQLLLQPNTD